MAGAGSGPGALYDRIGVGYDTTRRADPYLTDRLAELLGVRADATYLDVACGTGNYTTALSGRGGRWFGVDRSGTMLATARTKGARVPWEQSTGAIDVTGSRRLARALSLAVVLAFLAR